jgi:methylmalonyl-CoA mutase cobalamin-binding subunit
MRRQSPSLSGQRVRSSGAASCSRAKFSDRVSELVAYSVHLIVASPLYEASIDTMARLVEVVRQAEQVEIAVGVLIFSEGMTPVEAWDHLHARAAEHGSSVVECAQRLIDEHERSIGRPEEEPS